MSKNSPFSFFETDYTKLLSEMKIPGLDVEAIIASQRKNLEAAAEANQLALRGVQSLVNHQSEIMQQTLEEANLLLGDLLKASSPQERAAHQTLLIKIAFEKALANVRELAELVAKSNAEAGEIISKRVSESLDELRAAVSKTVKSSPSTHKSAAAREYSET